MPAPAPPLSLADHVCLTVVAEAPTHGWDLVRLLRPDGELGRIWSLSRPLTYRSIDHLVDTGLVDRSDSGRRRMLRATPAGRGRAGTWLDAPVAHLRDLRTEFLLKVRLLERRGRSPTDLAIRQLDALEPTIAALLATDATDPVERWRQESARASRRFLEHLAAGDAR